MGILRIVAEDYFHGFKDSILGLMFIRRILAEDAREIQVEPPERRERTVLQMRREKQGIFRRPPEPPKKKDSLVKKLTQIYAMNIGFVVVWQLLVFILSFIFGLFGRAELGETIGYLMIAPIFVLMKIVQMLWFSDISGACMRALNQPPPNQEPMGRMFGETVTSLVHQNIFFVQAMLSQYLPIPLITPFIFFVHMSLLNSMYCFDYFYESYNFSFNRRANYYETRWPYFLGFGTPLTIASSMFSSMFANGVIYALFFPLFIISSYKVNWARKYDGKIPQITFCRISYFLTQRVAELTRWWYTPTPNSQLRPVQKQ
ncbi:hypothetical protein CRE_25101 [Caenorhabditis remanei]|uniref:Uncharacterized protein n=1 Tax=Caenorhabditis remanei TaxID=31234 RepID=E3LSX0_CAERE|nr:hypothetical protein CRE_25101 [Caenorhabditis remanei]